MEADRTPLPQRVKQENLASPLGAEATAAPPAPEPNAGRSPEELRAMMSSLQQGIRRGRAETRDTEGS